MTERWVWDFGAAKGCGASVVKFDPKAPRPRNVEPLRPLRRLVRPAPKHHDPTTGEILAELGINKIDALHVAYRLSATVERRSIPQDLRVAVARLTLRVSGDRNLAHQILYGDHDSHLQELLP